MCRLLGEAFLLALSKFTNVVFTVNVKSYILVIDCVIIHVMDNMLIHLSKRNTNSVNFQKNAIMIYDANRFWALRI